MKTWKKEKITEKTAVYTNDNFIVSIWFDGFKSWDKYRIGIGKKSIFFKTLKAAINYVESHEEYKK